LPAGSAVSNNRGGMHHVSKPVELVDSSTSRTHHGLRHSQGVDPELGQRNQNRFVRLFVQSCRFIPARNFKLKFDRGRDIKRVVKNLVIAVGGGVVVVIDRASTIIPEMIGSGPIQMLAVMAEPDAA